MVSGEADINFDNFFLWPMGEADIARERKWMREIKAIALAQMPFSPN